jgi:hypothetical protein
MLLYHATPAENKESIETYGLIPDITSALADDTQLKLNGVYGFDSIDSARKFASYQDGQYIIYSFETDGNEIVDPEYNGDAYFVETDSNVEAIYKEEA